jgi:putative membrane protein
MMGWDWADGGGAGWWVMGLGMFICIILLAVSVGLVVWLINRGGTGRRTEGSDEAQDLLRRRFASGEIDADEYARRMALLRK